MSGLVEKIKLSSHAKKTGRANESPTGNNFYESEPLVYESKNVK